MPHMTITELRKWSEQVSGFNAVELEEAWRNLLLHKPVVTIRKVG
jgi:hypothetical protein